MCCDVLCYSCSCRVMSGALSHQSERPLWRLLLFWLVLIQVGGREVPPLLLNFVPHLSKKSFYQRRLVVFILLHVCLCRQHCTEMSEFCHCMHFSIFQFLCASKYLFDMRRPTSQNKCADRVKSKAIETQTKSITLKVSNPSKPLVSLVSIQQNLRRITVSQAVR